MIVLCVLGGIICNVAVLLCVNHICLQYIYIYIDNYVISASNVCMILWCPSTGGEPGSGDPEAGDGGEDQQRERGGGLRHGEGLPPVLRRGAGRGHRQTRIRSTGSTGSSTVVAVAVVVLL